MNPKAISYFVSWLVATLAAVITHNFPWVPTLSPEVQEIIVTLGAWAVTNFIVSHQINPAGLVSRSKGKQKIKEIAASGR